MLDRKTIERLGGWEGYRVERVVWPEGESRTVTIYLKPSARTMHCEHCGNRCRQVHETTTRRVRDLPLMALRVTLVVPRRRVWCEQCGGPHLERLSWLGRYQRVTDRLAEAVSQLLESSNILAVARFFQLGWHTVKALDKALLRRAIQEPDWSQIHYLAMDEFALHKGHRYA
ncbi:ISL3 family transposase, partial [Bordetella holmesii]